MTPALVRLYLARPRHVLVRVMVEGGGRRVFAQRLVISPTEAPPERLLLRWAVMTAAVQAERELRHA